MEEQPTVDECQRMESPSDALSSYDPFECRGCENFNCIFMPESEYRKFMEGEMESMFPEGMDDGFNIADLGEK